MTELRNNLHSHIFRQHGRDVLKSFRTAEKVNLKFARWINHRIFNIRCARANIIPRSLKLKSNITGNKANKILNKAEKKLLNIRISKCSFTIEKLRNELSETEAILFSSVSKETGQRLRTHLDDMRKRCFEEMKCKQREKFRKLVENKKEKERQAFTNTRIDKSRWVINKSDRQLSQHEKSVLEKGLNFAVTTRSLPVQDVVTNTEIACRALPPSKAQSLRGEVVKCLKKAKAPRSNISKEERIALQELKRDRNIITLPADKGRAIVLLNREEYDKKMLELLKDTKTYSKLDKDPTNEYKNQLISILRRWQKEQPIPKDLKDKIYPTSQEVPKIYGTPKIHKPSFPLRPIVSSIGSVSYYAAKIIADILSPLVGNTIHHIKNSGDFVTKIQGLEVPPGQAILSYDVSALFTSIPVPDAMKVIEEKIKSDDTLSNRTPLSPNQILELLKFCLETTYFSFKGNFYKQTHGAAMGSPVSPIVANIYMESFEKKSTENSTKPTIRLAEICG